MKILGIESSCDETAVAIYDEHEGVRAHEIYSQIDIHRIWGGVVPELASRDHCIQLLPLIKKCLADAHMDYSELTGIAYTAGPGLIGALMVGACMASTLGLLWKLPVWPIHHLEGHILAPLIEQQGIKFPLLVLLVSGGHTMILKASGFGDYRILGQSVDDALGEAFDKTAKLIGLPYPGGPELEKLAQQGDSLRFNLPRPMCKKPGLDMSFSGLKTAVVKVWSQSDDDVKTKADLAAAFQLAVRDVLQTKMIRTMKQEKCTNWIVCGGVAANQYLRSAFEQLITQHGGALYIPNPQLCTDNGAMIAYAGMVHALKGCPPLANHEVIIKARWDIAEYLKERYNVKSLVVE